MKRSGGIARNGRSRRNVTRDDSTGPNSSAVADGDRAQQQSTCADAHIVADPHHRATVIGDVGSERDVVVNVYASADLHTWVYHDSERVVVQAQIIGKSGFRRQDSVEQERIQVGENPGES
jgi:Tfp pilus tip-associated adhesin PilY1